MDTTDTQEQARARGASNKEPWESAHQYRVAWDVWTYDESGNARPDQDNTLNQELHVLSEIGLRFGIEPSERWASFAESGHFQYTATAHSREAERGFANLFGEGRSNFFKGSDMWLLLRAYGGIPVRDATGEIQNPPPFPANALDPSRDLQLFEQNKQRLNELQPRRRR